MIKLLLSLSIWLLLSLPSSVSHADVNPECADDPRECIDIDPNGKVTPKDPSVLRTFSFPPIKAGFVVDMRHWDVLPHIGVEVLEIDAPWSGDFSVDINVATSRVFTSLTWEFLPIIKAGPLVWAGYNVKEKDAAYGIGFSILDF